MHKKHIKKYEVVPLIPLYLKERSKEKIVSRITNRVDETDTFSRIQVAASFDDTFKQVSITKINKLVISNITKLHLSNITKISYYTNNQSFCKSLINSSFLQSIIQKQVLFSVKEYSIIYIPPGYTTVFKKTIIYLKSNSRIIHHASSALINHIQIITNNILIVKRRIYPPKLITKIKLLRCQCLPHVSYSGS